MTTLIHNRIKQIVYDYWFQGELIHEYDMSRIRNKYEKIYREPLVGINLYIEFIKECRIEYSIRHDAIKLHNRNQIKTKIRKIIDDLMKIDPHTIKIKSIDDIYKKIYNTKLNGVTYLDFIRDYITNEGKTKYYQWQKHKNNSTFDAFNGIGYRLCDGKIVNQ